MVHLAEAKQHHGTVVHIGIKLIIKLEVPSAGGRIGILHAPVSAMRHLLFQHPVSGSNHARIIRRQPALPQCEDGVRRIPYRRLAGLHAEGGRFFNAQALEFIHGANELRIVHRISQAAQRDDGIHHGGINGCQAIAHLKTFQHPLFGFAQGQRAQRPHVYPFEHVGHAVEQQKEVSPTDELLRPAQLQVLLAAADKQLVNPHLGRNFFERLFRVSDGERHQNAARPGRNFVDVEPEPIGEQDDLRRNGGHTVVVVLSEEAQINLGESIDFADATKFEDLFARARQCRMIGPIASQFQAKISLH